MKHILKTLDESIKQSGDMEALNNGCIYYKTMLSYMEAIPGAKSKNQEFYDMLVKLCYNTVEDENKEDDLTPDKVQKDTEIVRGHVSDYYRIMLEIIENRQERKQ